VTVTLLLDGHRLLDGARNVLPARHRDRADEVFDVLYRTVGRYFAGSLLVAVLNGLFILIAGLSLGVPLAPLAAVWAMTTNLIPQIGGFLGGSVFVTLAFTQGAGTGVVCLILFLCYQQFENHVLQPTVVGQAVDLSPPVTMMATLIGASTAGVPGALVAVPLVGTAKVIAMATRRAAVEDGAAPVVVGGRRARHRWIPQVRHRRA
jgi:putative heme transporter